MWQHLLLINLKTGSDVNVERLIPLAQHSRKKQGMGLTEVKGRVYAQVTLHHSPEYTDLLSKVQWMVKWRKLKHVDVQGCRKI